MSVCEEKKETKVFIHQCHFKVKHRIPQFVQSLNTKCLRRGPGLLFWVFFLRFEKLTLNLFLIWWKHD